MKKPDIDLVLLCYGKFESATRPCLESLVADCADPAYRLTVVDNGSVDGSAQKLREYLAGYPHVRAEYIQDNIGYAGGMNYGVGLTEAEWLVLVSNDTRFAPGALRALHQDLQKLPPEVGLVGPITNAAGNGQSYPLQGTPEQILAQAVKLQQHPCQAMIPAYRLDFYCVAVRKAWWDRLRGFDPVYGKGYYEDTDFSMRARDMGCGIMICEDAFVYHMGGGTFASDPATRKLIKRNKKIFLQRHPRAKLPHQRECNLDALNEFLKLHESGHWNEGLVLRARLRLQALQENPPRSPLKKWLWQRKVREMLKRYRFLAPA